MMFSDEYPGAAKRPQDLGAKHPFNMKLEEMMVSANEYARKREAAYVPPKNIPDHIYPKYNFEFGGYGMWNRRLGEWCYGEHPKAYPPVAETPEKIILWYKDNI